MLPKPLLARSLVVGLAFGAISACSTATPAARATGPAASSSPTITRSVVGTNDVHGGIVPVSGRGGLAVLAGYVNNLRAIRKTDGGDVLLIDGGDMFQGTLESNLTEGAAVAAAYGVMG